MNNSVMTRTLHAFTRIAAVSAAAFATAAASAHEIWFAPRAGELALVYGHGAEDLPVFKRLGLITSVGGVDATGRPVAVTLMPSDPLAFVDVTHAPVTITATLDNGLWSQAPDGRWVNKGKDEVPGAARSGRYLKYGTHLRELPKGAINPVPGLMFQIVPASTRFPQLKGDPLVVRVLLDGQPAVGAQVWADSVNDPDAKPIKVNQDGRVMLAVRNQGLNVIKAELQSPPADKSKADKTEHTATLSFVLPHAPE